MERSTMFKNGKPSISMGHLYHGYVSHNQVGYAILQTGQVIPVTCEPILSGMILEVNATRP